MKLAEIPKTYSIAEAAKLLKRGQSWVKANKAKLLELFAEDKAQIIAPNESLNQYGFELLEQMKPYLAVGNWAGFENWVREQHPELGTASDTLDRPTQPPTQPEEEVCFAEIDEPEAETGLQMAENLGLFRVEADAAIGQDMTNLFNTLNVLGSFIEQKVEQTVYVAAARGANRGISAANAALASQIPTDAAAPKVARKKTPATQSKKSA